MFDFSNTDYWKPVPNAEHYVCNPTGVIFNKETGVEMGNTKNTSGHPRVHLRLQNGTQVLRQRNHLVAALFLKDYDPNLEVLFHNGDKEDVSIDNLYQNGKGRRGPRRVDE